MHMRAGFVTSGHSVQVDSFKPARLAAFLALALLATMFGSIDLSVVSNAPAITPPAQTEAASGALSGQLPVSFVPNHGQWDPKVKFQVQTSETSLLFTRRGVTMVLSGAAPGAAKG